MQYVDVPCWQKGRPQMNANLAVRRTVNAVSFAAWKSVQNLQKGLLAEALYDAADRSIEAVNLYGWNRDEAKRERHEARMALVQITAEQDEAEEAPVSVWRPIDPEEAVRLFWGRYIRAAVDENDRKWLCTKQADDVIRGFGARPDRIIPILETRMARQQSHR